MLLRPILKKNLWGSSKSLVNLSQILIVEEIYPTILVGNYIPTYIPFSSARNFFFLNFYPGAFSPASVGTLQSSQTTASALLCSAPFRALLRSCSLQAALPVALLERIANTATIFFFARGMTYGEKFFRLAQKTPYTPEELFTAAGERNRKHNTLRLRYSATRFRNTCISVASSER